MPKRRGASQDADEFGKDMGLVHEAVVTGRKIGAGRDFWAALAHSEESFRMALAVITSQHVRLTIVRALNILGDRKVLTVNQAALAWKRSTPDDIPIRYSEKTLQECSELNRHGADWRLVYVFGLSLREQHQLRGDNPGRQPCFFKYLDWWLKKPEDKWATQQPEPGYYLIDFNGRWSKTSWVRQEEEIAKLGPDYERAHEAVVSEAVLSIYHIYQERLLERWYHWGRNLDSYGGRVCVGFFVRDKLYVDGCPPVCGAGDRLRACVARKFKF